MFHFFGLSPNYKIGLHDEIFSLCYHGQGGFTWKGGTLNLSAQLTTSIQYFENNFQSIVSNSL